MMSGIDNKKAKRRKVKKGAVTKAATPTKSLTNSEVPLTRAELNGEAFKNLEKLMDAHDDESALKMLSFPRGTNPFLDRERCLLCNCERQDPPEAESLKAESQDNQSLENNPLAQLPLWVCPSCRKAADQEMEKKPSLEQFLDTDGESFLPDISIKSGSEPTTPNGSICTCDACTERRYIMIESEHELETAALQQYWTELRKVVRCLYGNRDENNTEELNTNRLPADDHVTDLVHKLCSRDPHQLFLRLESQVREFVIEMKVKLLKQLSTGFKTPPQAKKFISLMLEEYAHLCKVARKMAGLLKELQNHLKRFKVTWDLHNKHLFQSIVFSEPSIKNSLNLLISQLRLGAASKESYTEDTYPNLLHRYLKFEDEMSVINVVWRDCHQLIESYNEEQSALKLKQKMLREDWEFFKTQRKLLEQQVSKNPKASLSHNLEAQFTETMRLMLQGNKPSQDELTCPRCNRKRCPCDECTITHMITCGIINPDVLDSSTAPNPLTSHHNANFMHDPNRYRIDVSPPSMSSTTSSSGSSSPIMVDPERLNLPFQDDSNRNEDEIQEEIDNQSSDNDDEDDEGVDDDDDDDDADDADNEEEADATDKDESNINDLPLTGMVEITGIPQLSLEEEMRRQDFGKVESCNCDHCVSQAKLEQVMKPEDNQCQCHVCLQQQGKAISTTLPQHIPPIVPRPGELHLYPHIHGSTGLHTLGRGGGHVRPILQPNLYDLHLPNQRHKSIIQQTKVPIKLDFDSPEGINDHIYHAYGDWDNTTYDPRLLLGSGKFDSELLPPPPFSSPYTSTLLTEPLNLPGMFSTSSSLPTSATSSAFVSTFANHTSSAAATQAATKITDNLSVLTTKESLGEQLANKHNQCSNQTTPAPNHNPPCSRPATLGGNNAPKVPEKGHSQHCKKHNNTRGNAKSGSAPSHNHNNNQMKMPEMLQTKEGRQMFQQYANSLKQQSNQNNHPCTHANNNNNNNTSKVANHLGTLREPHQGNSSTGPCPNSMQLPTSVNNVSVGTSTVCTEPDCDGNHDNDSFDDNCSEKSSSTSNSTSQKEGKYCDCCYCEFFGHGNPPMAPTSKNYAEMRDKLRLRLKKKTETKTDEQPPVSLKCTGHFSQGKPAPVLLPPTSTPPPSQSEDPLETKGLDELIKFINGTEEEDKKPLSAKAAKRARQKQRKAEEKARQEAEQLRKEQERERKLKIEEEQRRQAEEAERRKNEAMTKKQRKQAAKRAKSSSNSPTPPPANSKGNPADKSTNNNADQLSKNSKKKGKHKEDLPTLQVNITCEIEHGSQSVSSSSQKSLSNNIVSQNPPKITATSSRPSTQGGHVISTPPSIDNRNFLISKQNKNKEPIKAPHLANGDSSNSVTINSEHIAQITRQQQELLKKQTQQLIQLKLQQEAKKQLQLAAQQQQQTQQQQQQQSVSGDKSKKVNIKIMQNEKQSQGQVTPPTVNKSATDKTQAQPVQNNVKITVKTSTNSTPTNSPRLIEQNNNVQRRTTSNGKTVQQINEENVTSNLNQQQSAQNRRNKKLADSVQPEQDQKCQQQLQHQYHVQGLVSARQVTGTANHTLQHNGTNSNPAKGQVRQPPAGQAQNGDTRTPNVERRQEQGKKQEDSPPSDQGKSPGGKTKKVKRKNKGAGDINFIDEVFMPKSESDIEGGDMDEFEREIEEFKRFCADSSTPAKREKLQVNVNIKDIFAKKKTGLCN
ncbi:protein FAM193A-like isoform X3 [Mercenaria mercenaria]|uniref:protein FAM193A-like isoform X3 n=1 Tax=Mercenaria mercenaria TaxID=6596 RepID=UPI00234F3701|nr:protein FAM193A-like isoform X3 [Mercenaria mercenaria]